MLLRTYLFATAALACVIGVSAAGAASQPFTVTSTLDGKTVLAFQQHWTVVPHTASGSVREVDFLIDGKLRELDNKAPYTYGGDDEHGHLGFLYTSWLTPGKHRFTALVKTVTGQTATDTVVARVPSPPPPPAELGGTWTRTVTSADTKKATSGEPPPAGNWKLMIDRVGAWMLDPMGSGVVNAYQVSGNTLRVLAPIQMAPFHNGNGGISRFGHHNIGGLACREDGPPDTFTWSVSGNQLTLTGTHAPCGDNRAILEGTWTRG
jgi:hypothetical protein